MFKFNPLNYKRDLKNAQHFAFIQAFITALLAENFSVAKIVAKLQELQSVFSVEDRWYMIARASEIIAQRELADKMRDRFYTRLHRLVQAWEGSGMEGLDAAATALIKPFDLYKVKINAQIDEESGQLDNIITDLSTAAMQAHIQTLGGMYLFNKMKEAHEQVKALRLEQGTEESEKVVGALAKARKECDRVYEELTALLEAFAMTAEDSAKYEAFIRKWNGTVKIYQDMLDRKSGNSTAGTANPDGTGNVNENQNENQNENENNGGATPTTPDTPDTPDNPGTGGGGSGSGGDADN